MLASWHFFSAQALNTTHFHSQAQGCQVNTPPCLDALSEWVQRETSKSFAFSTNFCTSKTLKEKKNHSTLPSAASWLETGKSLCSDLSTGWKNLDHSWGAKGPCNTRTEENWLIVFSLNTRVCDLCLNALLTSPSSISDQLLQEKSSLSSGIQGWTHPVSQNTPLTA